MPENNNLINARTFDVTLPETHNLEQVKAYAEKRFPEFDWSIKKKKNAVVFDGLKRAKKFNKRLRITNIEIRPVEGETYTVAIQLWFKTVGCIGVLLMILGFIAGIIPGIIAYMVFVRNDEDYAADHLALLDHLEHRFKASA